jgi:glycerol-3-phosphate acyltransferase PlsY
VVIGIAPITMAFVTGVFFLTLMATRYVSVASMTGAVSIPTIMAIRRFVFGGEPDAQFPFTLGGRQYAIHDSLDSITIAVSVVIALVIIYTHRGNLERLRNGTENKAFTKKESSLSEGTIGR